MSEATSSFLAIRHFMLAFKVSGNRKEHSIQCRSHWTTLFDPYVECYHISILSAIRTQDIADECPRLS